MGIKVLKDKYFTRGLIDKSLSKLLLDEIASKTVQKEEDYDWGKGRNILKEQKPVRNINKNPQSYGIINIQKKVVLSHKL